MFDHVTLRVADRAASERFYETVLQVLGRKSARAGEYTEWEGFSIAPASAAKPATQRLHLAFAATSHAEVDAWWEAGRRAGYADAGAPGPRPEYGPDYYGGFLLDPDGNSAEAVHHGTIGRRGDIDHLWIRVADVAAGKDFYAAVAAQTGFELKTDTPERVQFAASNTSFSLVAGDEPTQHVHLAFGAPDDDTVRAFHRAALTAGVRDNGAPGERLRYHPGYYAAFVLDPAGHNLEVVHHGRPA